MNDLLAKVLPYGLGWLALLAVLLFLAKIYFSELIKALAQKSPHAFNRGLTMRRSLSGRQLRRYKRKVEEWYDKHPLGFEVGAIDIRKVYVPLQYEDGRRREDVHQRLNEASRTVVLGAPGAGKSLLLKRAILRWAEGEDDRRIPVMVDLHRCNTTKDDLRQLIIDEFDRARVRSAETLVDKALADGRLRVYFDGLDEVGRDDHDRVVQALREFARINGDCQIVVTCRIAAYFGQLDADFEHIVSVAEFDDASIRSFLGKWADIGGLEGVDRVFRALRKDTELMRLARSPLLLTMIAYLQSGDRLEAVGLLPNSRAAFYEKAVVHLLDRDRQLGRREAIGIYHVNRKLLALQLIALTLQENHSLLGDRLEIAREQLDPLISELLPGFNLSPEHAEPLLEEIVKRSQLLMALDKIESRYSFAHLTLQEYLAARALHNDPDRLLINYRRDPESWRETAKMWCAVASVDCTGVVSEIFANDDLRHKILALECLADAVHIDPAFAAHIIAHFEERLGAAGRDGHAVAAGLGALAGSGGPRGSEVLERLCLMARQGPSAGQRAAVQALSDSGRPEAANVVVTLASDTTDEETIAAVREMGEVAVPSLMVAASKAHFWAIEALAAIGTPAAAEALCRLLRSESERIAAGAAWELAFLLRNPDIEEGLRQGTDIGPVNTEPTFLWIWSPFSRPDDDLAYVVGRIASLVDAFGDPWDRPLEEDSTGENSKRIDPRIGIPVAAFGLSNGDPLPVNVKEISDLVEKAEISLNSARPLSIRLRPFAVDILTSERATVPDPDGNLLRLRQALLDYHQIPLKYRQLILSLSWPVQMMFLGLRMCESRPPIDFRMWLSVLDNPSEPRVLRGLYRVFHAAGIMTIIGLSGLRLAVNLSSFRPGDLTPWGPIWMSWGLIGIALLAGITYRISEQAPVGLVDEISYMAATLFAFTAGGYAFILSLATVAAWTSWNLSYVIAGAAMLATFLLDQLVIRRERAIANPLRRCLLSDIKNR